MSLQQWKIYRICCANYRVFGPNFTLIKSFSVCRDPKICHLIVHSNINKPKKYQLHGIEPYLAEWRRDASGPPSCLISKVMKILEYFLFLFIYLRKCVDKINLQQMFYSMGKKCQQKEQQHQQLQQ